MRLTVYTDYMLRVAMYLALKHKSSELATIDHIALAYGISRNHLVKIVHAMGRQGMVETVRGRTGGIRLARAPAAITLGEIVRLGEGDFAMVECQTSGLEANCMVWNVCHLKSSFERATNAFLQELDSVTLEAVTASNRGMDAVLGIGRSGKRIMIRSA
jgi:Rrf2 family transcriptional regulator, nitric oxide-sensitive transcriptional repressor